MVCENLVCGALCKPSVCLERPYEKDAAPSRGKAGHSTLCPYKIQWLGWRGGRVHGMRKLSLWGVVQTFGLP